MLQQQFCKPGEDEMIQFLEEKRNKKLQEEENSDAK